MNAGSLIRRRSILAMISAVPIVARLDEISKDELELLKFAVLCTDSPHPPDEEKRSWSPKSGMPEMIRSLARRGYLEPSGNDGIEWYIPTKKGRAAVADAGASA